MKYCRNKRIDKKIREYAASINYWTYMQIHGWDLTGTDYAGKALRAYSNAIRRLEKLKSR